MNFQLCIFILASAYMVRKICDSEHARGKSEARYAHMADVNHERTDDINALNAKLLRKEEQIERLEEEVGLKNLMVLYLSKKLEGVCELAKAGALVAAEIDRLLAAEVTFTEPEKHYAFVDRKCQRCDGEG